EARGGNGEGCIGGRGVTRRWWARDTGEEKGCKEMAKEGLQVQAGGGFVGKDSMEKGRGRRIKKS
ncbi:hypothetical protein ACH5RR_006323, partial [Cinchona calisaya]